MALCPRTGLSLWWDPCTEIPVGVGAQQLIKSCPTHPGPCCASPTTSTARSVRCSFQGKRPDPKSGFVWDANPLIFHVCAGRGVGDDFTALMTAERNSSAGRTFRKHISFCRACDWENIWLTSFFEAPQVSYVSTNPEQQTIGRTRVSQYFD